MKTQVKDPVLGQIELSQLLRAEVRTLREEIEQLLHFESRINRRLNNIEEVIEQEDDFDAAADDPAHPRHSVAKILMDARTRREEEDEQLTQQWRQFDKHRQRLFDRLAEHLPKTATQLRELPRTIHRGVSSFGVAKVNWERMLAELAIAEHGIAQRFCSVPSIGTLTTLQRAIIEYLRLRSGKAKDIAAAVESDEVRVRQEILKLRDAGWQIPNEQPIGYSLIESAEVA